MRVGNYPQEIFGGHVYFYGTLEGCNCTAGSGEAKRRTILHYLCTHTYPFLHSPSNNASLHVVHTLHMYTILRGSAGLEGKSSKLSASYILGHLLDIAACIQQIHPSPHTHTLRNSIHGTFFRLV